jgi:methylisocitrate lyase
MLTSPGRAFRSALDQESPLQIVGTINAFAALLAAECGFKAIYLSGAGVANASLGRPDLGITTAADLCEDVRRITSACDRPLLVDADTGFGSAFNIARTCTDLIKSGAAGMHLEDQVQAKRCGHRPGKALVETPEMCDRIKAAVDARTDDDFLIMARTDAQAVLGQQAAVERAGQYVVAGADLIFAEALQTLDEYRQFVEAVDVPVLANITEFGMTPLFSTEELGSVGIRMVLYPLSAFRAMSKAALEVYRAIRTEGTQRGVLDAMQTRDELYEVLGYLDYERTLDRLFGEDA